MTLRTAARNAALVVIGVAPAFPLAAQPGKIRTHAVELTIAGGYFTPTGPSGLAGGIELTPRPAWAATLHLDFNAKNGLMSVEFSTGLSPERLRQVTSGAAAIRRTHVKYGAAKIMFGRNPRKNGISFLVGGGLSVINRMKSVTDAAKSSTDFGGSAGAMLRFPIDGQVGLRLDVEDLIYKADYGRGSKLRNDLVWTAGLSIAW
ncbi:MAG: hypothetical protein HOP28_14975 [Gemmatimonadales bacterium]|nr:hypothetical protein [Gemmatimonadales bacterium]